MRYTCKVISVGLALSVVSLFLSSSQPFLLLFFIGKDGCFREKVEAKANSGMARVCLMCNMCLRCELCPEWHLTTTLTFCDLTK